MSSQLPKRSRGQPALPGRRVVVKLEERHIERARTLGAGKVTRGIRKALERSRVANPGAKLPASDSEK